MKKYLLLMILALAVAFCLGCNDDSSSSSSAGSTTPPGVGPAAPTGAGMPTGATTPGMPGGAGMSPSGAPMGPGMAGGPTGMTGATTPGMPGMAGGSMGMPGATAAAPAEEASSSDSSAKTLEAEFPGATVVRDTSGELKSFYNPAANGKTLKTPLTEHQSREVALDFIRANYYYFDSMSFEFRNEPGKLSGGKYNFKWVQIIRETKRTGNAIMVTVNPYTGMVVNYKAIKNNWTN